MSMDSATVAALTTITSLIFSEAVKESGKKLGVATAEKVVQLTTIVRKKFRDTGTEGLLLRAEREPSEKNIEKFANELEESLEDVEFADQVRKLFADLEHEGLTQEILKTTQISGGLNVGDVVRRIQYGTTGKQSIAEGLGVSGDILFGNITQKG
jgi:hypothetical protein